MRFSDLVNQTKTIPVTKDDDTFNITYRVDFYTGEMEAKLQNIEKSEEPLRDSADILSCAVTGWDLTEDDDVTKKPINKDVFMIGGMKFCMSILKAIIEDVTPNAETSNS